VPKVRTVRKVPKGWCLVCLCLLWVPGALAQARAPEKFIVRLDTTRGAIVIECFRAWAAHGADRFYELVTGGY